MKRFLTLVVLLIALLAGAGFALTFFGFQFDFRDDAKFDPVAQFVPAKKRPLVFNRRIRKNLRRRSLEAAGDTGDVAAGKQGDEAKDVPGRGSRDETSPGFDIVSIDPAGTSVIAGHAPANEVVAVYAADQRIGTAKADSSGNWVLVTEQPIGNPDAKFTVDLASGNSDTATSPQPASGTPVTELSGTGSADDAAKVGGYAARNVKDVNARMIASLETLIADARTKNTSSADVDIARQATVGGDQIVKARNAPVSTVDESAAGAQPKTQLVPVPIQFVYREATFTQEGEKAAQLLLEFLQVAKPKRVGLSGHADERGTVALNFELSRERLLNVERYLREGGYDGELELVPKGEAEPFAGIDRSKFDRDDLYQLDRRVELRFDE